MKKSTFIIVLVILIFLTSAACGLPYRIVPVATEAGPFETMTALFSSGLLGSLTPQSTQTALFTSTAEQTLTATVTETVVPPTPTYTETATITQTPIPTTAIPPTLAPVRVGPVVVSNYVTQPPIIDGNWDDFKPVEYSASYVTYGSGYWASAYDLSSSFKVGWDNYNLYVAARVIDDVYVQNSTGNYLYLGDSLEILLDTDLYGDFYYNQLSPDDYQLGISPGLYGIGGTKEAYLWFPRTIQGRRTQVTIASISVPGGYQVEAAIPWGLLNVVPIEGEHYGFSFSVSDNDSVGSSSQQSMVSNDPNRHLTLPMTWGELVLIK
jgi:hypothetical protein